MYLIHCLLQFCTLINLVLCKIKQSVKSAAGNSACGMIMISPASTPKLKQSNSSLLFRLSDCFIIYYVHHATALTSHSSLVKCGQFAGACLDWEAVEI